jgi:hypothetical protein
MVCIDMFTFIISKIAFSLDDDEWGLENKRPEVKVQD